MSGDIAQLKSMSIDIVQRKLRAQDSQVTKLHEITDTKIENDKEKIRRTTIIGT